MGTRALENRIMKLKALEAQQKEIESQIEALKDEIKADLDDKGVEQQEVGQFLIRWTRTFSGRFDTKAFRKEHERLYSQYVKQVESRRFSIA